MPQVILFHHALGLTQGVRDFGQKLQAAGHSVATPDLYDGKTFDTLEAGVAYADEIGMSEIIRRGVAAVAGFPTECIYAGFSLGSLPAQKLAQTRGGALGVLLFHGGCAATHFGCAWPYGVALQVHVTEADKWNPLEEVRQLTDDVSNSELFVYPGSAHLVAEPGFEEYDPAIAALIVERSIHFLNRWRE